MELSQVWTRWREVGGGSGGTTITTVVGQTVAIPLGARDHLGSRQVRLVPAQNSRRRQGLGENVTRERVGS
jgi:hypothetical protein